MTRVRINIASNIAGQAIQVLLAVVCTPLYIKLLGIEAFGLIAFYVLIQTITQMLDLGLSTTANREIARLSTENHAGNLPELSSVVGTIECWYWILGIAVGVVLFFWVPNLAIWWLRPEDLLRSEILDSARIFSFFAVCQWPLIFYQSALLGLQRQFVLNAIQIPFSVVSSVGGLIFIWFGPRTVSALFAWQVAVMLVQLFVLYGYFWRYIGVSRSGTRVDLSVLRNLWRFSLGMSGISIAGLIVTHLDKVVLSRYLSLEAFGYYSLAGTLAKGLYVLMTPIFNAYFPRFSSLAAAGDNGGIRMSYHSAAQLMAALSLPLMAIVVFFSFELATLWLHNTNIAASVAPIAGLLVIGNCLNGLMSIPFALQLANGRTRISLYTNTFLVVVLVPAILVATSTYGAVGAAATWAFANALYVAVGVPVTHRYLLVGEAKNWLRSDILPPLIVGFSVVGLGRMLTPDDLSAPLTLLIVGSLWIVSTVCAAMSVSHMRTWGLLFVSGFLKK